MIRGCSFFISSYFRGVQTPLPPCHHKSSFGLPPYPPLRSEIRNPPNQILLYSATRRSRKSRVAESRVTWWQWQQDVFKFHLYIWFDTLSALAYTVVQMCHQNSEKLRFYHTSFWIINTYCHTFPMMYNTWGVIIIDWARLILYNTSNNLMNISMLAYWARPILFETPVIW